MTAQENASSYLPQRRFANVLLFLVTAGELILLVRLTPSFTLVDWIYVLQNLLVLGIALARSAPLAQDHSLGASFAVVISMTYPYAQVICLDWAEGYRAWPAGGLGLVGGSACLSLACLVAIGRSFGLRPALRKLATRGPYQFVRHPMYLAYFISDIGYQLDEWNVGTLLVVLIGWTSLVYRIGAEERILSRDASWSSYTSNVPYRLVPGVW